MEDLLQWIASSVEGTTEIRAVTPLKGGISATLHRLDLLVDGEVQPVVVREFTLLEWLREQPDLAEHEAESLKRAERVGVATPRLIAYTEEREVPAILMTKLPGEVVLEPQELDVWLRQLAETLVAIHRVPADGFKWTYRSYNDPMQLQIPDWSEQKDLWRQALALVQGPRPETRECFIHRDYHPTNVLWQNGEVSGVVDWVNACRGPAGIDAGHCRLNLALLKGVEAADYFLDEYVRLAGDAFTYDPYWDLLAAIEFLPGPPSVYQGWVDVGVTNLTPALMKERYEGLVAGILAKQV
ncbi:phosphotransferase family protein [Tumebacillus flagellatus]|uniref:Aminoglycoside phosphotransferase domain-containing protein n=1 Tax=Tumebacillus flagellatus TaxID=1157490 RepID=A0A074LVD6_9BACL|nr:aminoglycoside phosphotransferase family protein [Tumebacillus flagellatus]KEO84944.1 hypothetical protein EL26_02770 [Tumebacillus flagellatus]